MSDVFMKPARTDEAVRYESKTVRAVRGTEARTIAKWQKDGWELDTQTQASMLRTEITFRRRRASMPQWQRWAVVGAAILLAVVIAVGVIVENLSGGSDTASTALSTPAAAPTGLSAETPAPDAGASQPDVVLAPSAAGETLTVANNADLAALLALSDPGAAAVAEFTTTYRGRTIEFDANIAAMSLHGDYDTRFDILVSAGDFSETTMTGPSFQFRDVNLTSDLGLTGANVPASLGVGTNLHVVAEVVEYDPTQQLLLLEPVSTQVR